VNLIEDAWIPATTRNRRQITIRPAELTAEHTSDPIVALAWPRADLRIAGLEFLIGLLATACPPASRSDWIAWWRRPPSRETLDAAFAPIAHAFELDGDGPRFLQDFEVLASDSLPVERLLIDLASNSPGENKDLLARQGRIGQISRAAAAMALFALQSWAPSGGRGNRTGLRGGGPLSTLVLPSDLPTLWQTLWANVPPGQPPTSQDLPRVFPWLAPTLTSEGARVVTPLIAHPLQAWWGMPRRIRLDFVTCAGRCDLTGEADTVLVTGWRQRPYGANYAAWTHPATPHYQAKPGAEWLPMHVQPTGIGYRDWLGLVLDHPSGQRTPASIVTAWRQGRAADADCDSARLLAAGYDMDNMKARAFTEAELPLHTAIDPAMRDMLGDTARGLVQSAEQAADLLRQGLRAALFGAGATVKFDSTLFAVARERFWQRTDGAFHAALDAVAQGADIAPVSAEWRGTLELAVMALFDEFAPLPIDSAATAPRISRARRQLGFAFRGYGKPGIALFTTLGLAPPVAAASRKGRAA
jgi:CRISPR system Cascade subunit CasA